MSQIIEITEPEISVNDKNELIIGIDLGTTNSLVAIIENDVPVIIEGSVASVVGLEGQEFIIGEKAMQNKSAIYSIKRLMGKNFDDLDDISKNKYIFENRDDKQLRVKIGNSFLSPEEISSKILKKLKVYAENYCKQPITKAVITVPAYFDERARVATKNASVLAGLEVVRLLNEPTAAAVAYGLDENNRGIYAVYDLGGGTFDASILNLTNGVFHVLATAGNVNFGGDDIDYKLLSYVKQKFLAQINEAQAYEIDDLYLLKQVRLAKESLSTKDITEVSILVHDITSISLTKDELEEIITPDIKSTINILNRCIRDSEVDYADIKGIILVGGSSRLSLIKKMLKQQFNIEIFDNINPDIIVAQGAAMQANNLSTSKGNVLLDVVPISLGIEIMGGLFESVIHRNSITPISVSKDFTTYEDGQTAMSITILQGEREMAKDCRVIGKFSVKNIPQAVAGQVKITITFKIDADGLLSVESFNKQTGELFRVEVNPNYGLTAKDMENILREAILHQEIDVKQRIISQEKLMAKNFIEDLETALTKYKPSLSQAEILEINNKIILLKDLLNQEEMAIVTQEIKLLRKNYYKILDLKYSL
jgi:molecular chaperone HscA